MISFPDGRMTRSDFAAYLRKAVLYLVHGERSGGASSHAVLRGEKSPCAVIAAVGRPYGDGGGAGLQLTAAGIIWAMRTFWAFRWRATRSW